MGECNLDVRGDKSKKRHAVREVAWCNVAETIGLILCHDGKLFRDCGGLIAQGSHDGGYEGSGGELGSCGKYAAYGH